jgi:hypothetical protein
MHAAWFEPDFFVVSSFGILGPLLGLLLIGAQSRWYGRLWLVLATAFTTGLGLFATAAFFLGQAPGIFAPALFLASAGFVFLAGRLPGAKALVGGVRRLAAIRIVRWSLLLCLGPCAGLAWALHVDQGDVLLAQLSLPAIDVFDRSNLREVTPSPAFTDAGTPVRVYALGEGGQVDQTLSERERAFLESPTFAQRIIRLSSADTRTNCYGWVFAGGHYWIRQPECIEAILKDNDYRAVAAPETGDLVVYRNSQGQPCHVGLVRAADADGLVLVESKWGWLGRFLHSPENQPYSDTWTIYRSERSSHVLRGIESDGPNTPASSTSAN